MKNVHRFNSTDSVRSGIQNVTRDLVDVLLIDIIIAENKFSDARKCDIQLINILFDSYLLSGFRHAHIYVRVGSVLVCSVSEHTRQMVCHLPG